MAEMGLAINPYLRLRNLPEDVTPQNVDAFLDGCEVVVDGIDFFQIGARRMVFNRAHQRRIPVITCGPVGFSVALLTFLPDGPSFDEFLGLRDGMDEREQLIRFAVALAPAGLHLPYLDARAVDLAHQRGPSSVIAINLCAGVAAAEAMRLLLGRGRPWAVPGWAQFDAYRMMFRRGRLRLGHRHPLQQFKRWYVTRRLREAQRDAQRA
jgi:hypothetical protein